MGVICSIVRRLGRWNLRQIVDFLAAKVKGKATDNAARKSYISVNALVHPESAGITERGVPTVCDEYPIHGILSIYQHLPTESIERRPCLLSHEARKERAGISRLDLCRLLTSPREASSTQESNALSLHILEHLRTGVDHRAQLLKVVLDSSAVGHMSFMDVSAPPSPVLEVPKGTQIVAKIYDPLFYPSEDDFLVDPFLAVEAAYTHECTAYRAMKETSGVGIPHFYGSFSALVDCGRRVVHGVLLEFIDGVPLTKFWCNPNAAGTEMHELNEKQEKDVIEQLIRLDIRLFERYGVNHEDLAPRNLLLSLLQEEEGAEDLPAAVDRASSDAGSAESTCMSTQCLRYRLTLIDFECCTLWLDPADRAAICNLDAWLSEDDENGIPQRLQLLRSGGWIAWSWREWVRGIVDSCAAPPIQGEI